MRLPMQSGEEFLQFRPVREIAGTNPLPCRKFTELDKLLRIRLLMNPV